MNVRQRKINQAMSLIKGDRPPKIWRVVDGVCNAPGYPDEVQPQDITITVTTIYSADMVTNSKTGEPITPEQFEAINDGTLEIEADYSAMTDGQLRDITKGINPFNH